MSSDKYSEKNKAKAEIENVVGIRMGCYLSEVTLKMKDSWSWLYGELRWNIVLKAERTACAKSLGQKELDILQEQRTVSVIGAQ